MKGREGGTENSLEFPDLLVPVFSFLPSLSTSLFQNWATFSASAASRFSAPHLGCSHSLSSEVARALAPSTPVSHTWGICTALGTAQPRPSRSPSPSCTSSCGCSLLVSQSSLHLCSFPRLLPSSISASSGCRCHTYENGSQACISKSDHMASGKQPPLVIIGSLRLDTSPPKAGLFLFSLSRWASFSAVLVTMRNNTILQFPDPSEPSCHFIPHSQSCTNSCHCSCEVFLLSLHSHCPCPKPGPHHLIHCQGDCTSEL